MRTTKFRVLYLADEYGPSYWKIMEVPGDLQGEHWLAKDKYDWSTWSEWVGIEDIFEGDVVENDTIGIRGVVTWAGNYPGWIILPAKKTSAYVIHNEWKVLGNMWQNTDLLLSL